jgi:hypothetical protein
MMTPTQEEIIHSNKYNEYYNLENRLHILGLSKRQHKRIVVRVFKDMRRQYKKLL